jgi:TRAP-type C4-dicarboxylate transport system substrate-binding protein
LRQGNWLPPTNHFSHTAQAWINTIEKASGGRLKVKLDKSALAKPPGQYDLVKNGVRDLTMGVAGYTPGRFQLFRMAEVPFATLNAEVGSPGLHKWYTKHGFDKQEFTGTKLIVAFVHGPGMLHSKKEIKTLEDIKGVKIRVGGGGVLIAKSLGAVPVAMSATKANESLTRGTTEAAFFPYEAVKGFRLVKLVKYHLEIPGGLYTTSFFINMNKKKWDGLPGFAKAAFNKAGGVAGAKLIGRHWDDADQVGKNLARKAGNKIQTISAKEKARWAKAIRVVRDNWIKKANDKGMNGDLLLKELLALMKG